MTTPISCAESVEQGAGRDEDGPCTCCNDSGITIQTERACACAAGDEFRPDAETAGQGGSEVRLLLGVSGSFTATHVCGEPTAHEHTWTVLAWFETPARADARCYQAMLDSMLASWNGKPLPAAMEWGEDIARVIGSLVNCVEVVVSRDAERIHARWLA